VDFVVAAGRDSLAIEVKASTRWTEADFAGLRAFVASSPACRAAVLAHSGTSAVPLGDRLYAIPLDLLVR
jgi:hypothetical protein